MLPNSWKIKYLWIAKLIKFFLWKHVDFHVRMVRLTSHFRCSESVFSSRRLSRFWSKWYSVSIWWPTPHHYAEAMLQKVWKETMWKKKKRVVEGWAVWGRMTGGEVWSPALRPEARCDRMAQVKRGAIEEFNFVPGGKLGLRETSAWTERIFSMNKFTVGIWAVRQAILVTRVAKETLVSHTEKGKRGIC